jgi:UDP-glucuronate decarboxylase
MHPNDGRVVSNFIVQALTGQPITIFGDGTQTRSFQYVDDLIEGMVRMMNTGNDIIGPVNLGNPNEFSMLELAREVLDITGSSSKIIHKPLPQDDPTQRKPDISLAQEMLDGWEPRVQLRNGLRLTVEYFDKLLSKA